MRLPGGASALVARPSHTPAKGVVSLPSMWGTTAAFENMAEDLTTTQGWAVCIPEIITDDPAADFAARRGAVGSLVDDETFQTLREAAETTAAPNVALIGFCVGGMYAMKATAMGLFDRIVAFYGMVRIPEYWRNPGQGEPLEYLRGHTDRVLAIYGERDDFIPIADIEAVEAVGVRTVRYPDANHAFAADPDHKNYRPDDAADAWRRALEFIAETEPGLG